MKSLKVLVQSLILVTLFAPALPTSAQGPLTYEDPFGGLPILGTDPNGVGAVARFGLTPEKGPLPGGIPSTKSGNGTSPRRAINITSEDEPVCSTFRLPAGTAGWFKLLADGGNMTHVWLDDERADAREPSGGAVWGAADRYMVGTPPGSAWRKNALNGTNSQDPNFREGYVLAVYDPDNLKPNYAFSPPNAAILTLSTDNRGLLLNGPGNRSLKDITGAGIAGYGNRSRDHPQHLLWYQGHFGGWAYVMVYNQMIWDDTASLCTQQVEIIAPPVSEEGPEEE